MAKPTRKQKRTWSQIELILEKAAQVVEQDEFGNNTKADVIKGVDSDNHEVHCILKTTEMVKKGSDTKNINDITESNNEGLGDDDSQ